ncbi:hypothetical protein Rleg9DRAFT_0641 [Rhizobium leguminosarum bv. trifolii WSM597]|uniref:Uncharacterized protein n=1 Tax=Rhizobium leguminosarum bv. trifolii WSM597 TaxID=754764 RepID=J0GWB3_RHILT|nr:hypothetical protein [Rhizobium leguminosarum]EJB01870.1 hypothetical protein Rleg9DRAFT_0641 [Rhizobium leguminosarum bv. trifolii WSM597]
MTTDQNLMLYTKLTGFRLVVLANRFGCDSEFSRELHDRLAEGLEAAIAQIQAIMALESSLLADNDEFAAYHLEGAVEIFGRFTINMLDELEIDYETHEYRINGGGWMNALTADDNEVEVNYPKLVVLSDNELGSLALIAKEITMETGIPVHAARADYIP